MRLLRRRKGRAFSLGPEFVFQKFEKNIPPYAILSHRWFGDEPTFEDIKTGRGKDKDGYAKLQFCAEQAANDNLAYFWVDTVCIDKSSSEEVSESINSMFRWYKNSEYCYVYMHDVSKLGRQFRQSVWFTRGWTLQELIAPPSVEFFARNHTRLGSKSGSLRKILHKITGISIEVFREDRPLSTFGVEERMSWVQGRETEREEDRAYCLMGIFDISMPVIYGELGEKAFERLWEAIDKRGKKELSIQRPPSPPPSPKYESVFEVHQPSDRASASPLPQFEGAQAPLQEIRALSLQTGPTDARPDKLSLPPEASTSPAVGAKIDPQLHPLRKGRPTVTIAATGIGKLDAALQTPPLSAKPADVNSPSKSRIRLPSWHDLQPQSSLFDRSQSEPVCFRQSRSGSREKPRVVIRQKVRNNGYNCFGAVLHQPAPFGTVLFCDKCDFSLETQEPLEQLSLFNGRVVPVDILWTRFHFQPGAISCERDKQIANPFLAGFRCFICKDRHVLDLGELMDHLKRCHTLAEICD